MNKENASTPPLLSILVPSYNDEACIRQCLESLLRSDRSDFELVVSDDCSDDGSVRIVEEFDDERLTLVKSEYRNGAIDNWKKCLTLARGQWVHFVGSDDYYEENTVDAILDSLRDRNTVYLIPLKCFQDGTNKILDVQCTSQKIGEIFQSQEVVDWTRLFKFFNHDELVNSIFPRELGEACLRLSKYSTQSPFMYWVIAIFYNKKVVVINGGALMKRYEHITKRAQWGQIQGKKSVISISLRGLFGDLYNSAILAIHFDSFVMLLKLCFKNRFHATKKGGFYGLTNKQSPYYRPGSLINLLLGPVLIIANKVRNYLKS